MLRASCASLVSKKNWRLKCCECRRLLPAAHFPNINGPKHLLVCANCKRMCVACGITQPLNQFPTEEDAPHVTPDTCLRCLAKEHVAKENVYFRYPILKYRACPFSVDAMRDELRNDDDSFSAKK